MDMKDIIMVAAQGSKGTPAPTSSERVTDGGFDNAGAWTPVNVTHVDGSFTVGGSKANFTSRTEYRLEQEAAGGLPAGDYTVNFDYEVLIGSGVNFKIYLGGNIFTAVASAGAAGPLHFSGNITNGGLDTKVGIQISAALTSRTAYIDNLSIVGPI